ncbi:unnamed protein product [Vitrella brassicaformis CCMP3155]|uniref:Uncharacterized protein n=2 Tax=Vitrella brassicaformis TaxID=1169539 RepID=A0A0G4FW94_VITBC|nr:unnamed protein product [Vitrella brassicaformis CCMP3155]|eukprot:CEM19387.1 unnamed protein product [Vitrella brassicaformis CCMP3155]
MRRFARPLSGLVVASSSNPASISASCLSAVTPQPCGAVRVTRRHFAVTEKQVEEAEKLKEWLFAARTMDPYTLMSCPLKYEVDHANVARQRIRIMDKLDPPQMAVAGMYSSTQMGADVDGQTMLRIIDEVIDRMEDACDTLYDPARRAAALLECKYGVKVAGVLPPPRPHPESTTLYRLAPSVGKISDKEPIEWEKQVLKVESPKEDTELTAGPPATKPYALTGKGPSAMEVVQKTLDAVSRFDADLESTAGVLRHLKRDYKEKADESEQKLKELFKAEKLDEKAAIKALEDLAFYSAGVKEIEDSPPMQMLKRHGFPTIFGMDKGAFYLTKPGVAPQ